LQQVLSVVDKSLSRDTFTLMMEAEMISETLGLYTQMTRLIAQVEFIEFSCHETSSVKS
jgi:hypothetical protein